LTAGYTGAGHFTPLYFTIDGHLRGWALTRVYATDNGAEACLVDIFAPRPDFALYTWMVSEAAVTLAAFEPRRIVAQATCPILQAALRRNRFTAQPERAPTHLWPKGEPPAVERVHLTMNHTDTPLRPYPDAAIGLGFLVENGADQAGA
jgi:hypothetical protein